MRRCHRRFCAVVKNVGGRADLERARGAVSGGTGRCVAQTVRDQGVCAPVVVRAGGSPVAGWELLAGHGGGCRWSGARGATQHRGAAFSSLTGAGLPNSASTARGAARKPRRMRVSRAGVLALVLFSACASSPDLPPDRVDGMPWSDAAADQLAVRARLAIDRGEPREALALLEQVLAEVPGHVDARRLRQDVLRDRGRRGLLVAEAERAVAQHPDDAIAHYLRGRVVLDPHEKRRCFARAVALAPGSIWPWLGLAHGLRDDDPAQAVRVYERLFQASGRHPMVGIALAATLREQRQFEGARRVYGWLADDPRSASIAALGLAQIAAGQDRRAEAFELLIEALRARPFDGGGKALALGLLEAGAAPDQVEALLDVLREDPMRWREFTHGDRGLVLALLLQRSGRPLAALQALTVHASRPPTPTMRRLERRLLLANGDVAGFLEKLAGFVPRHVVDDERNQVRARWLRLVNGPWCEAGWQPVEASAVELLAALRDAGLLVEAELLAEVWLHRWPEHAGLQALYDEVRRELAFEGGLRRLLYRGYQNGDTADLAVVVQRVRELSMRVFGSDVVGVPDTFHAPLVGEMLDPFVGGLAAHLARYNRHLVLGRRAGGVAEGLMLTRLAVQELPEAAGLHLPGRCFEVVGCDREITSLGGVLGGDLAGVALLNHFLIDHDAVRDWARTVLLRRQVAREDGEVLRADPLPAEPGVDPLDVAWRLALAAPVDDQGLDAAVLDMIRIHERQHLVDAFYFLPIEANLWRGLGLLFSFGFSPGAVEAEMERRAELAALALSPHPELVLAHVADFLAEPGGPAPHHTGFAWLADDVRRGLQQLGVPAAATLPARWHELPMAKVQQAARQLLGLE